MDIAALQTQNQLLQQQVSLLSEALQLARLENALLRQKLDKLCRRFFGQQSEQLNDAQMELLLSGLPPQTVVEVPARKSSSSAPRNKDKQSRRIRTPDNFAGSRPCAPSTCASISGKPHLSSRPRPRG